MKQPQLHIGILEAASIEIAFTFPFAMEGMEPLEGNHTVSLKNGDLYLNQHPLQRLSVKFEAMHEGATFQIKQVKIGIGFHWEQYETQQFKGNLLFKCVDGKLWAINEVGTEAYITSVITSEMNVNAPEEFVKAHAVISRSWALAQLQAAKRPANKTGWVEKEGERILWYDKQNHTHFDLCADDHCQRYQGLARITNNKAEKAIKETFGEVLTFNGEVCDARFSKCCGGISEDFENVWQEESHPYLTAVWDDPHTSTQPDVGNEEKFETWLRSPNPAFCNTHDSEILASVLNDYDQTTSQFFRWEVRYTPQEISSLIKEKSGIDFGEVLDLVPLERGRSGRIIRLKIVGTQRTMVIGKELEIRRFLSKSHLLSSAFTCKKTIHKQKPVFTLTGAGWGHGVGLCQIGAAVMSYHGYSYKDILAHYFKGAKTTQLYGNNTH